MLGHDVCHLYLRYVEFGHDNYKANAGAPPPAFVTTGDEETYTVDRSVCTCMHTHMHTRMYIVMGLILHTSGSFIA